MAESTLAITFARLKLEVAEYIGWSRDSGTRTSAQNTRLEEVIDSGLREFYGAADWRFLRPIDSITAWATATGTMTVSGDGNTTITDSTNSPFYASMIGHALVATTSGNSYTIVGYTSTSVVTVDADASADDGDTFTITADGYYRMPDDFAGIRGRFTFAANEGRYLTIPLLGENIVRRNLQYSTSTGRPTQSALCPVAPTSTRSHRWDALFSPIPDADYPLYFRKSILPDALVDTTAEYPYGGAAHSQTILEACLYQAELIFFRDERTHADRYRELLGRSVQMDRRQTAPDFMPQLEEDPFAPKTYERAYREADTCEYVGGA